jgi:hypothetical protein
MGRGVVLLAAAVLAAAGSPPAMQAHDSAPAATAFRTDTLSQHGLRVLARLRWHEAHYVVSGGETVRVSLSPAYASDPQAGQRWADFFASLPHNSELALLDAYIAPLDEVEKICGGEAYGCYGGNHLVTMGEPNGGVTPQSVATHEYGHHIAGNRINPPWLALDWGTKRWSSVVGVCARQRAGTAFPGNEDEYYILNPGEAFAESYRVLVEGPAADWPLVDDSFRPTAEALDAVREDVAHPWIAPTATTINGRLAGNRRTWTTHVATPYDGELRLRLSGAGGGRDMRLLSSDGQKVLATGSWTADGGKSVEYVICGQRSVTVRVTTAARASTRFRLLVRKP